MVVEAVIKLSSFCHQKN